MSFNKINNIPFPPSALIFGFQSKKILGCLRFPTHASLFQTFLQNDFVPALYCPAPAEISLRLIFRIIDVPPVHGNVMVQIDAIRICLPGFQFAKGLVRQSVFKQPAHLFCPRDVFPFPHSELAFGKCIHVLFQMVQVKNVLCIGKQLFCHVRNPCRSVADEHRFLIAAVTVLERTPVQMLSKLTHSPDAGNILPFFYTVLLLAFFVLPIINVVRGIDHPKLVFTPCGAFLILVPCVQRRTVCFDIKDSFLPVLKIQLPAFLLLEQVLCLPAVLLEYRPADAVRHLPDGVVIDFHAVSIPDDILGCLVGTLVLGPIGAAEHKRRGHFKREPGDSKCVIQGKNTFRMHVFQERFLRFRSLWNQHGPVITEGTMDRIDQLACTPVGAQLYSPGLELPFFLRINSFSSMLRMSV